MNMKKAYVIFIALTCLAVSGCVIFDAIFGTNSKGEAAGSGGGILGAVATALGWAGIPWATTVAGAATSVYSEIRRRKWKGALEATAKGVNEFRATPEGASIEAKLTEILAKHQELYDVRDMIREFVHSLEVKKKE